MRTARVLVGLCFLGFATGALAAESSLVTASASAQAVVTADRARVQVSVEKHAVSAGEAAAQARLATNAVLETVKGLGLPVHVIQSTGYTVEPDFDFQSGKTTGYGAKTTLAIDTGEVASVGRVLDALMSAGITSIHEIRYLSTREEDARASALRAAVAAVTRRAKVMAEAAGGQLGELVELSTEPRPGWHPEEITVSAAYAGVAGTVLPVPEVQVSAVVYATWRYVPAPR